MLICLDIIDNDISHNIKTFKPIFFQHYFDFALILTYIYI